MARFANWAGHAVKQTGWNLNPRAALAGLALVGGVALLAAFYLALSSQTAVLGRRLQEMEEERAQIVRENAYLRDQIARTLHKLAEPLLTRSQLVGSAISLPQYP